MKRIRDISDEDLKLQRRLIVEKKKSVCTCTF